MQRIKRIIFFLFAVLFVFGTVVPTYAAVEAGETEVSAEQILTITYRYPNVAGISGTFTYSNIDLFSDIKFYIDGLTAGQYNPASGKFAYFGFSPVDCTITLVLTVSADAAPGDSCTITMEYESTSDGMLPEKPVYQYDKVTINVVTKLDYKVLQQLIDEASALDATKYTAQTWKVLDIALSAAKNALNSTTQEEIDAAAEQLRSAIDALELLPELPTIDYTALLKNIKIAEALNKDDYTAESFAVLEKALAEARSKRYSTVQEEVDAAAKKLKNAIDQLVLVHGHFEVDYSTLLRQIALAESLYAEEYTTDSWTALLFALDIARAAVSSDDQQVVDHAAAALADAIKALVQINAHINYDELLRLIAIAESLDEDDYTKLSWSRLANALEQALLVRRAADQHVVDAAAKELRSAIDALVVFDIQALLDAIAAVEAHTQNEALSELWYRMHELLNRAELAIASQNVAEIESCTREILALLAEIEEALAELKTPQTVVVERPMPTDPTDDFCNIENHVVWRILFFVSLALNLFGVILVATYFYTKRRKTTDDTPLVDYDISDDES